LDPFRRDILSRDIKKTFWRDIEKARPDLLLIDFAEEVYDLLTTHEERSFVTNSNYLSSSLWGILLLMYQPKDINDRNSPRWPACNISETEFSHQEALRFPTAQRSTDYITLAVTVWLGCIRGKDYLL
jgi:hypothetical protein